MSRLPRLALGTVQPEANVRPMLWGLTDRWQRLGHQVQTYYSRAHFVPQDASRLQTGRGLRYLDSWVMSQEVCRELFWHGSGGADLAVVVGSFLRVEQGGALEDLCTWLDLPRVVVIDVSQWSEGQELPRPEADVLLLDGLVDPAAAAPWQARLEARWGLPVLAALVLSADCRAELSHLDPVAPPPSSWCQRLGAALAEHCQADALCRLADRRPPAAAVRRLFRRTPAARRCRVATAFDECFHCYFPTTLELLEMSGAEVLDFSPLRDEQLPADVDLVVLGCGHPEQGARARVLAENHLMKSSLQSYVRGGGRVYAEGGAASYLGECLIDSSGQRWSMAGVLPLESRWCTREGSAEPTEVRLNQTTWLGEAGTVLRGYTNPRWQIRGRDPSCAVGHGQGAGAVVPGAKGPAAMGAVWSRGGVVASAALLHFPAQAGALARLMQAAGMAAV